MLYEMSEDTKKAIALLHNAHALSVGRERRPLARDVARACKILLQASGTIKDLSFMDALIEGIPGKMRLELNDMFSSAVNRITEADYNLSKNNEARMRGKKPPAGFFV